MLPIRQNSSKSIIEGPHRALNDRREGHTVPERVGPRGADNAANLVLACLPCAQAVNPPGRRPLPKKNNKKLLLVWLSGTLIYSVFSLPCFYLDHCRSVLYVCNGAQIAIISSTLSLWRYQFQFLLPLLVWVYLLFVVYRPDFLLLALLLCQLLHSLQ